MSELIKSNPLGWFPGELWIEVAAQTAIELDVASEGWFEDFLNPCLTPDGFIKTDGGGYDHEGLPALFLTNKDLHRTFLVGMIKHHTWKFSDPRDFWSFLAGVNYLFPNHHQPHRKITKLHLRINSWCTENIEGMTEILESLANVPSGVQGILPNLHRLEIHFDVLRLRGEGNVTADVRHPWGFQHHSDDFVTTVGALQNINIKQAEVDGLEDQDLAESIRSMMVEGTPVKGLVRQA